MRYSKKRIKKKIKNKNKNKRVVTSRKRNLKNRKLRNKSKTNLRGGGAMSSIMSMIPFMSSSEEAADELLKSNHEISNSLSNQSVLVGALCNQYIKNNIRGNNTEYDPVLDTLCTDSQVSLVSGKTLNNVSSSKKSKKKKVLVEDSKSQTEGVKLPSFLDGMKGLANLYSAPMKAGFNAINSGINTIQNYKKKSASEDGKKSKKHKYIGINDIERAELEIKTEATRKRDEVVKNLSDNKNLDIKQVIKETSI